MAYRQVEPIISVIVPVYNVEDYIDRCVESIKSQTYKNLEIILVDDGSTDTSGILCEKWRKMDKRIIVIHKENGGLVSARKAGISKATGEYATVVDSDDWIEHNMLEELLDLMISVNADITTSGCIRDYGNFCMIDSETIPAGVYEGRNLKTNLLMNMISTTDFFKSNISMHICGKLYKTQLLKECQMLVDDLICVAEDAACVYPSVLKASVIAVAGKAYYHYCMRTNSIMGGQDVKEDEEKYRILFQRMYNVFLNFTNEIPNIMEQFRFFIYYILLLRQPEKIVKYNDNVLVPFGKIKRNERVIIYGAGRFGWKLKKILEKENGLKIVAHIDKNNMTGVKTDETIENINYDKVIVAVLLNDIADDICMELKEKNVPQEKILRVDSTMFI